MNEIERIKEIALSIEDSFSSDPYTNEVLREKLMKEIRRNTGMVVRSLDEDAFTPPEVLSISSVTADLVSLSGNEDIIRALKAWVERNREKVDTTEVRLYTEEAERMLSSLGL